MITWFNDKEIKELIELRERMNDYLLDVELDDCPMDYNDIKLLFTILDDYLSELGKVAYLKLKESLDKR